MKTVHVKQILSALTVAGVLFAGAAMPGVASAATSGQTYRVNQGDTFWKISRRLGVSLNKLTAANPGVNAYHLQVGSRINLPTAAPAARHFVASAYSIAPEENGGAQWYGLDYFGDRLTQGKTIAVDPDVIPLGSRVWVSGYNWSGLPANGFEAHATDIGSAIQGNRIDIFLNGARSTVKHFGLQNVQVTVLN